MFPSVERVSGRLVVCRTGHTLLENPVTEVSWYFEPSPTRHYVGTTTDLSPSPSYSVHRHHHPHHLSLNRKGRWGITDDFTTTFLHFPVFSTALWDLANSRAVHSLVLSSHLFLCLPCLLKFPLSLCLARWF